MVMRGFFIDGLVMIAIAAVVLVTIALLWFA